MSIGLKAMLTTYKIMKIFITYGDDKFAQSKVRLCKEVTGIFDRVFCFGPENIPKDFKERCEPYINRPRGGGYWLWKPLIVKKTFKRMKNGDILVYCDSGCKFNVNGKRRLEEYFEMLTEEKPFIRFHMPFFPEKNWTTEAIFRHFEIPPGDNIREDGQYAACVFFILKTPASTAVVDKWYETALNSPQLFTDDFSSAVANPELRENRHDQSIFSVITKKNIDLVNTLYDETYPFYNDKPFWATRIRS